jgi:hypothetical protein
LFVWSREKSLGLFLGELKLKLEQMFPKKASFRLKATGKEYTLRNITLEDQVFIANEYGEKLIEIFTPPIDLDALSRIIYRLIINKGDFKSIVIKDYDDDGNETEKAYGGYKLLQKLISGEEVEDVIWAFNECQGISRPVVKEEAQNKKKVSKVKKKVAKKK